MPAPSPGVRSRQPPLRPRLRAGLQPALRWSRLRAGLPLPPRRPRLRDVPRTRPAPVLPPLLRPRSSRPRSPRRRRHCRPRRLPLFQARRGLRRFRRRLWPAPEPDRTPTPPPGRPRARARAPAPPRLRRPVPRQSPPWRNPRACLRRRRRCGRPTPASAPGRPAPRRRREARPAAAAGCRRPGRPWPPRRGWPCACRRARG